MMFLFFNQWFFGCFLMMPSALTREKPRSLHITGLCIVWPSAIRNQEVYMAKNRWLFVCFVRELWEAVSIWGIIACYTYLYIISRSSWETESKSRMVAVRWEETSRGQRIGTPGPAWVQCLVPWRVTIGVYNCVLQVGTIGRSYTDRGPPASKNLVMFGIKAFLIYFCWSKKSIDP